MNPPVREAADRPFRYVQVIPIYLASDSEVARYFRDCRDEIDAITGLHIAVLMAKEVEAHDAAGVAAALNADGKGRYANLGFGDLPCLWIEDEFGNHAVIRLPHEFPQIKQVLQTLADVCRKTNRAAEIERMVNSRVADDAVARSPALAALMKLVKEFSMTKSSEKLIALICGVVFVSIILVIALFIPSPTAFQYTVFRIVLALAAAGFVSMTPGFIEAKVGTLIRAGGALAVFVVVYFYAPAALSALT